AKAVNDADVILFNTCSVRRHAEGRVEGQLNQIKDIKTKRFGIVIGLVGCMAQNYKDGLLKQFPHLDFVAGPRNIYDIPDVIDKAMIMGKRDVAVDKEARPPSGDTGDYREDSIKAFVSIGEGCNNYCSYCIVPHVRGREASRQPKDIVAEVKKLINGGVKEITLLGQNVNSYGKETGTETNFVNLLQALDKTGIERIRFMTSHPKDATPELFDAMKDLKSVCEHLHLPLQSGSDKILQMMNRGYASGDYLRLVDELRSRIPDCAITTDLIVGFPTETDEDFEQTANLMQQIKFDKAFIFKYSPRPPAKSSELKDDVPMAVKERRNLSLLELQDEMAISKNRELIGKEVEVFAEYKAKKPPKGLEGGIGIALVGRARTGSGVIFNGKESLIGKTVKVVVKDVSSYTLIGDLVQ
ncbi:MAG: tRNA (N6-isopentenyl adenosine(37)-C2)-methylthiotransferase MiaB, partial [Candidatus Omnitrophica bacterium]|nr:tRNA (N6-isopentenyl adenosine(37)-C2)-methylthiotransferase MiaB [Candidatus Omnitrophota bacterium]